MDRAPRKAVNRQAGAALPTRQGTQQSVTRAARQTVAAPGHSPRTDTLGKRRATRARARRSREPAAVERARMADAAEKPVARRRRFVPTELSTTTTIRTRCVKLGRGASPVNTLRKRAPTPAIACARCAAIAATRDYKTKSLVALGPSVAMAVTSANPVRPLPIKSARLARTRPLRRRRWSVCRRARVYSPARANRAACNSQLEAVLPRHDARRARPATTASVG